MCYSILYLNITKTNKQVFRTVLKVEESIKKVRVNE